MHPYRILTDTCAGLPDYLTNQYQIQMIPLSFIVDGVVHYSYDIETRTSKDLQQFFDLMRKKVMIKTAGVNGVKAYEAFKKELEAGNDILFISFADILSVTYSVCRTELEKLKLEYPKRKIMYVDSISGSLGQGLLVVEAGKRQQAGESMEEVVAYIEETRGKVHHLFTVDSLRNLYQGGRVSRFTYYLTKAIDIKPILRANEAGQLEVVGKVLGRKRSLLRLVDMVVKNIRTPEKQTIYIAHGDCEEEAIKLKEMIKKRIEVKDFVINCMDIVMGAHGGPGILSIYFIGDSRSIA